MNIELEAKRLEEWDNSPDILELLTVIGEGDILEVGTGTGKIIEELSRHLTNSKFTGIDVEEHFIQIAKKKHISNTRFIVSDAIIRTLEPESFDYVIFRDSLHQIHNHTGLNGVMKALENAFYYLRKSEKLVIRDAVKSEKKEIEIRLNQYFITLFKRFLENKTDYTDCSINDNVITINTGDLVTFLGNWKKLEMDKKIPIRKSKQLSTSEYHEILTKIGFKQKEIRLYKYSSHLIPEGIEIEQENLLETYAMLVYNK